jgi:hypothetical protein
MKGDVKNKLHPRRRPEVFLDIQPPTCGLRGASGLDRDGTSLNQVQSDDDSMGLHGSVTNCIAKHLRPRQAVWVVLATRVLSETRGLWLYGVIRGGLSCPERLGRDRA